MRDGVASYVCIEIHVRMLYESIHIAKAVLVFDYSNDPAILLPNTIQPFQAMVGINLVDILVRSFYNKVTKAELLLHFRWELVWMY